MSNAINYQQPAAEADVAAIRAAHLDAFGADSAATDDEIVDLLAEHAAQGRVVNDVIIGLREFAGDSRPAEFVTLSLTEAAVAALDAAVEPGHIMKDPPIDRDNPGHFLVKVDLDCVNALQRIAGPGETMSAVIERLAAERSTPSIPPKFPSVPDSDWPDEAFE